MTRIVTDRLDRVRRNNAVGKGSATVPVALFGVSPKRWGGRFHLPNGAQSRLLSARRRDADGSVETTALPICNRNRWLRHNTGSSLVELARG